MASKQQQPQRPSLAKRRKSSQSLDPLQMPSQNASYGASVMPGMETTQDVVEEGKELFHNFIVEEIERESPDLLSDTALSASHTYKNPMWAKTGRDLRLLADQFAQTKERQRVRQRAYEVQINITYEEFKDMLSQLFLGDGITNERIVVLFYFCSDITIRSLQAGKDMFQRFMNWCLSFITDKVCWWVQTQGGWGAVLRKPFNSAYKKAFWIVAAAAIVMMVGFRYWRASR